QALDINQSQYLEDLVSIAVSSARQAEDVASQAHKACTKTRRWILALASFGALGLLVGVAGFAASRNSSVKLSEVRQEMVALQDMQRQASLQLANITSRAATDDRAVDGSRSDDAATAQTLQSTVPVPKQPVALPAIRYAKPWPNSRPSAHRMAPVRSRPSVVPRFFADRG